MTTFLFCFGFEMGSHTTQAGLQLSIFKDLHDPPPSTSLMLGSEACTPHPGYGMLGIEPRDFVHATQAFC